jgi:nitrogenase molybdenum-iron protein NifN
MQQNCQENLQENSIDSVLHFSSGTEHFVSTRNACKLCAPLGACIVMRGISGCIPLIHGSQGCSTYIRRYGISHFREPIDIASSNFVESTAIFGGHDNLFLALDNVTKQYQPSAIGITSTCLSETIGENVPMYLKEYLAARAKKTSANQPERQPENRTEIQPVLFYASTPSYRGTHIDGYHEAIWSVVNAMTEKFIVRKKTGRINVISGFVSAADLREIHEILGSYRLPYTLLPDYSESLDGGAWEDYQKLPEGGTPLADIAAMPEAAGTIYLGKSVEPNRNAATYLWDHFDVPATNIELPIGIENTDAFFVTLEEMTGQAAPESWGKHRNRLIDAYFDGHKYCSGKRAILYGDEDFVVAMASFLDEIGVIPAITATGAVGEKFEHRIKSVLHNIRHDILIMPDTDFATILDVAKGEKIDFVIGNSKGFYLARQLDIPLIRCGFPIHDRLGGHRILHLGYRGALNLFERICNALMEAKQNAAPSGWTYI